MNIMKSLASVIAVSLSGAAWTTTACAAPTTSTEQVRVAANEEVNRDNDIRALYPTPAETAKAKADAAAARKARAESTPGERATSAAKRKTDASVDRYPDNDLHAT